MKTVAAIVMLGALSYATWIWCNSIYTMGVMHGRYLQEQEQSGDLKLFADNLGAERAAADRCEQELSACENGDEYIVLTCTRGFCYK